MKGDTKGPKQSCNHDDYTWIVLPQWVSLQTWWLSSESYFRPPGCPFMFALLLLSCSGAHFKRPGPQFCTYRDTLGSGISFWAVSKNFVLRLYVKLAPQLLPRLSLEGRCKADREQECWPKPHQEYFLERHRRTFRCFKTNKSDEKKKMPSKRWTWKRYVNGHEHPGTRNLLQGQRDTLCLELRHLSHTKKRRTKSLVAILSWFLKKHFIKFVLLKIIGEKKKPHTPKLTRPNVYTAQWTFHSIKIGIRNGTDF